MYGHFQCLHLYCTIDLPQSPQILNVLGLINYFLVWCLFFCFLQSRKLCFSHFLFAELLASFNGKWGALVWTCEEFSLRAEMAALVVCISLSSEAIQSMITFQVISQLFPVTAFKNVTHCARNLKNNERDYLIKWGLLYRIQNLYIAQQIHKSLQNKKKHNNNRPKRNHYPL